MVKRLATAVAVLATILGATVFDAGSASAFGYEWLGCRIGPGSNPDYSQFCQNDQPTMYEYNVEFLLQNETGPSTYSWSIPSGYPHVGCGSSDNFCALQTSPAQQDIQVSVGFTQGANSNYLTAFAHIEPFCGSMYC